MRDAESSLQEAALEQVHELLLGRAAAAGKGARAAGPDDSAAGAARLLRVFLARLPAAGAAMRGFLGRGCAALKAKGRLPSKAAAVGLEAIVGGLGAHSQLLSKCPLIQDLVALIMFIRQIPFCSALADAARSTMSITALVCGDVA